MGAVYEAVREDLGQMRVAVKVMHAELTVNRPLVARFRREAETVAVINHPNIVRVIDFGALDCDTAYLAMELLDGLSLSQAITRQGAFSVERTAFVASQVLSALEATHR